MEKVLTEIETALQIDIIEFQKHDFEKVQHEFYP